MPEIEIDVDSIPNTVPEVEVAVGSLSPTDAKSVIAEIIKVASGLATITGNKSLESIVATVSSISSQDWFANLVAEASSLLEKGQGPQATEVLVRSLPPFNTRVVGTMNATEIENIISAVLRVASITATLTGNPALTKVVAVLTSVSGESWFVALLTSLSSK